MQSRPIGIGFFVCEHLYEYYKVTDGIHPRLSLFLNVCKSHELINDKIIKKRMLTHLYCNNRIFKGVYHHSLLSMSLPVIPLKSATGHIGDA